MAQLGVPNGFGHSEMKVNIFPELKKMTNNGKNAGTTAIWGDLTAECLFRMEFWFFTSELGDSIQNTFRVLKVFLLENTMTTKQDTDVTTVIYKHVAKKTLLVLDIPSYKLWDLHWLQVWGTRLFWKKYYHLSIL